MPTVSVELRIPEELGDSFAARVRQYGGDQDRYLRSVVERDLRASTPTPDMPIGELLALVGGPCPADAMSEAELDEFTAAEIRAHRAAVRTMVGSG